jgi:hypothetical protein
MFLSLIFHTLLETKTRFILKIDSEVRDDAIGPNLSPAPTLLYINPHLCVAILKGNKNAFSFTNKMNTAPYFRTQKVTSI